MSATVPAAHVCTSVGVIRNVKQGCPLLRHVRMAVSTGAGMEFGGKFRSAPIFRPLPWPSSFQPGRLESRKLFTHRVTAVRLALLSAGAAAASDSDDAPKDATLLAVSGFLARFFGVGAFVVVFFFGFVRVLRLFDLSTDFVLRVVLVMTPPKRCPYGSYINLRLGRSPLGSSNDNSESCGLLVTLSVGCK